MKITGGSELMKNQKHAEVMSPENAFDVLQTPDGDSLFFSIGTDHTFYVTREVRQSQTGWTRIDLSSSISAANGGAAVSVKTFALAQNPQTFKFDVAIVATMSGTDSLYMSLGHSNTADEWSNGITWFSIPFDAARIAAPSPLTITDVYLMTIPQMDDLSQPDTLNCFVDVIRTPDDPIMILDRYYITPSTSPIWSRQNLTVDLKAGSISSCLGHRTRDHVPGIYTFGSIEDEQELIFTQQHDRWYKERHAPSARLELPPQSSAIASALNSSGDTNLFIAAAGGLYLFAPDGQLESASSTLVVPNVVIGGVDLFANTTSLSASSVGGKTVVWIANAQGELFHVDCLAGSETSPSAWTYPIPFATGINHYAFFLNSSVSNTVLFAYSSSNTLLQFTQQHSGEWVQRNIVLPTTNVNDYIEYTSFTSHISVKDDRDIPIPSTLVALTSDVPAPVYVNDTYYILHPTTPVQVETDANGNITVIQETNTLASVTLTATVGGPNPITVVIDPLSKAHAKLQSVKNGDDLGNVTIQAADGSQKPLVPSDVISETRNAAAQSIVQLLQAKQDLSKPPLDSKNHNMMAPNGLAESTPRSVPQSIHPMTGTPQAALTDLLGQSTKLAAEDFFRFFKRVCHHVEKYVVDKVEHVWYFIVRIGEMVYHAILDTAAAILNAIEWVFNKITVAFEDLIKWLGFLFSWGDIKRTHAVLKHVLKKQGQSIIDSMDALETSITTCFNQAEDKLNAWANVTDPGETIGDKRSKHVAPAGSDDPQAHWALYHTQNGTDSAQIGGTELSTDNSGVEQLIVDLEALVVNEVEVVKTTVSQIKEQVLDHIYNLTPMEIVKKILAIGGDLILKTAKNLIVKIVDILKILVQEVFNMLDAPLSIPVLSPFYKSVTGEELTVLDLVCFVAAIPATVLYKAAVNAAPFPDDASVRAFTHGSAAFSLRRLQHVAAQKNHTTMNEISSSTNGDVNQTKFHEKVLETSKSTLATSASSGFGGLDVTKVLFNFLPVPSGALLTLLSIKKSDAALDGADPSEFVARIYAITYFFYMIPNFAPVAEPVPWYAAMNYTVSILDLLKNMADAHPVLYDNDLWAGKVSPIVECGINFYWLIPALGGIIEDHDNAGDITSFIGNIMFDVAGIISPGLSSDLFENPVVNGGTYVATVILSVLYVGFSVATAMICVTQHT